MADHHKIREISLHDIVSGIVELIVSEDLYRVVLKNPLSQMTSALHHDVIRFHF